MDELRSLLAGIVAGVGVFAGAELARRLADPYSEPRLTLERWLAEHARGGDPA